MPETVDHAEAPALSEPDPTLSELKSEAAAERGTAVDLPDIAHGDETR